MNKSIVIIIIYIIGIIVAAVFIGVWNTETSFLKTISVFVWTILFLIALFYFDKHESK
mgnify:CR=1 FL=1|tara:strand:- start:475 stop:648 length:174 start_codon:yes stop_codon:yes gene_type:complete